MTATTTKPTADMDASQRQGLQERLRTQALREQIVLLTQEQLVTVLGEAVEQIDDEHLQHALSMMSDDNLGTVVAKGILEQREREKEPEVSQ